MPNVEKANRRDKKREKARKGMVIGSKSVFVIQEQQIKRSRKIKRSKK